MPLNTDHLLNCIKILESSLDHLRSAPSDGVEYEVFRNAAIKGFELALETSGKLLRKSLKLYMSNPRAVDRLTYKDILRHALKHDMLSEEEIERWFEYRDNRNNTAQDYGKEFAEETLELLPKFLKDARALQQRLDKVFENNNVGS